MVQGEFLWHWVKILDKLKDKVIIWPEKEYDNPKRHILLSVDGIDCRTWEKASEEFNVDPKTYSHKYNHGGLKYEIGVDAYEPQVVWVSGPWRGGKHDLVLYSEEGGLREKIPDEDKVVVCDRVYRDKKRKGNDDLALPCIGDLPEIFTFKSRLRARQESLNGRLKDFRILFDTFHHNPDNHGYAFGAVLCLVQFAMNHGHPIFDANIVEA